jgi:hypothetical protein
MDNEILFSQMPTATQIVHYFISECAHKSQGSEGFDLYRDGGDYCYVWKLAEVDMDLSAAWLLEVRTSVNDVETRDFLYVRHNPSDELGGLFCIWYQKPVAYFSDDYNGEYLNGAFKWFTQRASALFD